MKQVAALVTEIVLKSDIKPWVERRCAAAGAEVEWHNVTQSTATYKEVFKSSPNVITWQCRMPHSWTSNWGNNVLHIENSLLCQRAGAFVDSRGFFSQSNLRVANNWAIEHSVDLDAFAQRHFGWKAFSGGNPDGPVLVTLQCRKDCNINFEYPASPRGDKVVFTLNTVLQHLPKDRGVLLRPHPRERDSFIDLPTVDGCQWSMDGDFASLLPQCSALVTVNSTCASEACLLGIPVAVLGTGAFTGSGAVYECHENLSRLSSFLEYQNDIEAQKRYCSAILGRHFLPYKHETEVSCPEFDLWLARLR
jgi:hypothetical protein